MYLENPYISTILLSFLQKQDGQKLQVTYSSFPPTYYQSLDHSENSFPPKLKRQVIARETVQG
jgi:hypothetical protein